MKILLKTCFHSSTQKTKFKCWFCEQLIETELISETDLEMFMSPNMKMPRKGNAKENPHVVFTQC